jgi:hypothetical protein
MRPTPRRLAFAHTALYWGGGAAYGLILGQSIRRDQRIRLMPARLATCRLPAAWPPDSGAFFE